MGQLMRTQLEKQKTFSRTLKMSPPGCRPVTSPLAPLLGRDLRGSVMHLSSGEDGPDDDARRPGRLGQDAVLYTTVRRHASAVAFAADRACVVPSFCAVRIAACFGVCLTRLSNIKEVYGVGEVYQTARPPPTYTAKPALMSRPSRRRCGRPRQSTYVAQDG